MSDLGAFFVVADQWAKKPFDNYKGAIEEIGGWADDAVILHVDTEAGRVTDWTQELAWTWFEHLSLVDDEPAEAFVKFVGEAVQEHRNASEDGGVWTRADAQYNEMMGK